MGHHYVPQRYLRNFEDASQPGSIWLHDKREGTVRLVPIAGVAQSRGFYDAKTEAILARDVETPANDVIEKLTNEVTIGPAERLQLAYYIGVMLKRTPARRRHATELIPGVLADVIAQTRQDLQAIADAHRADPELLAQRLRQVDEVGQELALDPPPEVLRQIREPWPSEAMLRALFGMTWRVLISTGPQYFITTDNPAFFFRAFGLATPESELSFPLSTTHALHGSWQRAQSDLLFVNVRQSIVKEISRRLASEAERLAFYHKPAPWLPQVLAKKHLFLSVIQW